MRFPELDSLRGIAAAVVVLSHFGLSFGLPKILSHFPLWISHDGLGAVILFFVLSGFVLTLPYRHKSTLDVRAFLIRRVCRIYLPYLGALALAITGAFLFHGRVSAERANSWWINLTWSEPVHWSNVFKQILFLGNYEWPQFNTAFWSLIYEMRISFIFPFLALAVLRMRSGWSLALALALSLFARPMADAFPSLSSATPAMEHLYHSQTFATLHYMSFFILGSLLAKNVDRAKRWYHWRPRIAGIVSGAGALGLIGYSVKLGRFDTGFLFQRQCEDWAVAFGASLLIVLALNADGFIAFLQLRAIHHLGTISYSLYLIHGTTLFVLIHLCPPGVSHLAIFPLYLVVTLAASEVFYRIVEIPSMNLGKAMTRGRMAPVRISQHVASLPDGPHECPILAPGIHASE